MGWVLTCSDAAALEMMIAVSQGARSPWGVSVGNTIIRAQCFVNENAAWSLVGIDRCGITSLILGLISLTITVLTVTLFPVRIAPSSANYGPCFIWYMGK